MDVGGRLCRVKGNLAEILALALRWIIEARRTMRSY
jgi:hypothetical protein